MSNDEIKEPEQANEENTQQTENEEQKENKDTIDTIIEQYNKQIADLKKEIEDMKLKHKDEIIKILKGNNGTGEKPLTEEEKTVQRITENINKYRR